MTAPAFDRDAAAVFAAAAQAARAAGAENWPALCEAMARALRKARDPDGLVAAAREAALPGRLELLQQRDALIHEIARSERYSRKAARPRALAEAIAADLADYAAHRHTETAPQHDPDRLFHRLIENRSVMIGAGGRTIGWNRIYQILMV